MMACKPSGQLDKVSFYHWKSDADNVFSAHTVSKESVHKIYLHYFDVDLINGKAFPVYKLDEVDSVYKSMDIVPVVFIVNKVLKHSDTEKLAAQIHQLTDEISAHHFGSRIKELQIDCDWSTSTRYAYFELLKQLKKHYELSCTVRLHQIKYRSKTGLPPVNKATLMLYNVGDLTDFTENSILSDSIVSLYINEKTDYPMPLDLALPLFAQTVLKSKKGIYKLINGVDRDLFNLDTVHFKLQNENVFEIKEDTLYKGFYLTSGDQLKLEELSNDDISKSYKVIRNSNLEIEDIIFYHLDSALIQKDKMNDLLKEKK